VCLCSSGSSILSLLVGLDGFFDAFDTTLLSLTNKVGGVQVAAVEVGVEAGCAHFGETEVDVRKGKLAVHRWWDSAGSRS